jgi:3-carboxy-cis,cis-muconate cycloisomerase
MLDALFRTDAIRAVFSDRGRLQGMLDFEAALARATARAGLIPQSAVAPIEAQCRADLYDMELLARAAEAAGNTAIPVIKALTSHVESRDPGAARHVHWGATSQDAMDTGLVLQLRAALALVEADLEALSDSLARLADAHRGTVTAGRTWLQHAVPTTFGLRAAGWLSAIERHRRRLQQIKPRVLALQLGGAAGTLGAMGDRGLEVAAAVAADLGLSLPDMPWHTQRDRVAEVATTLGLLAGSLGKIARDVSLSMQTEIGEASEPAGEGRGGSSTMPQKRNPVSAAVVLAAAVKVPGLVSVILAAMVQEHERGLGNWHAEWETLPEICMLTAGALAQARRIVDGLEVDAQRMRESVDLTRGLMLAEAVSMALAPKVGRRMAHQLVERAGAIAAKEGRSLREVLVADAQVMAHMTTAELDRALDPHNALGCADALIDAVLAARSDVAGH